MTLTFHRILPLVVGAVALVTGSCREEAAEVRPDPPERSQGFHPHPRGLVNQFAGYSVKDQSHAEKMMVFRNFNAPARAERIPDNQVYSAASGKVESIHGLIRDRPVVLVFGSASCNQFDMYTGDLKRLSESYGQSLDFHLIYIREAHPSGGFLPEMHREGTAHEQSSLPDAETLEERLVAARGLQSVLGNKISIWVDDVTDAAAARWGAWPARAFVISTDLTVIYQGGPGPFYFNVSRDGWHDAPPDYLENAFRKVPFDERTLERFLEQSFKVDRESI